MLIEHRGEVEFDFRSIFHTPLMVVARDSEPEAWRLLGQLLHHAGSRTAAAVAGWSMPISTESLFLASLYTAWTGQRHPLMPDTSGRTLTDVETRLADMALENMNRR